MICYDIGEIHGMICYVIGENTWHDLLWYWGKYMAWFATILGKYLHDSLRNLEIHGMISYDIGEMHGMICCDSGEKYMAWFATLLVKYIAWFATLFRKYMAWFATISEGGIDGMIYYNIWEIHRMICYKLLIMIFGMTSVS
jgi:hypothetical protein